MGIALFYFGVSEPIYHMIQSVKSSQAKQSFFSFNHASNEGILLTFFNFGIHGWVPFVLIAIAIGWAHYRKGLPLAVRSAFYPLLGERIYGWVGDFIDTLAAISCFMGVVTSMGLCTIMFVTGMNWESFWLPAYSTWGENIQNYEVYTITLVIAGFVGLISTAAGLKYGNQTMTGLAVVFSVFVPLAIFFMDDSWYVLNVMTESVGYYAFYFIKLSHHVDAFAKVDSGVDSKATLTPWFDSWQGNGAFQADKYNPLTAPKNTGYIPSDGGYGQAGMTGIYWGWWISMAPVVGIFMAKISKGRSIRALIQWGVLIPTVFSFFWISIFGGLGIKMERRAIIDGCRCACTTINMGKNTFDSKNLCGFVAGNPTGQTALALYYEGGPHGGEMLARNPITCATVRPAVRGEAGGCSSIVQPSLLRPEERWFALLDEYMTGGWVTGTKAMGRFLGGVTCTALICWLIVMMDTGCWVLDQALSNGEQKPHTVWRFLMLMTLIAGTCLVLRAASMGPMYDAAVGLQVISFIFGMILTLFLTALPVTVYQSLNDKEEEKLHPADDTTISRYVYPKCKEYGLTNGHAMTEVQDWTAEEIANLNVSNRWTQSVGEGAMKIMDFAFSFDIRQFPAVKDLFRMFMGVFFPYVTLPLAYKRIDPETKIMGCIPVFVAMGVFLFASWWSFFSLHVVEGSPYWFYGDGTTAAGQINADEGMWGLAWIFYIYLVSIIAGARYSVRQILKIKGNLVQDFFTCLFFWPAVVSQIDAQEMPTNKTREPQKQYALVPVTQHVSVPVPDKMFSSMMPMPVRAYGMQY